MFLDCYERQLKDDHCLFRLFNIYYEHSAHGMPYLVKASSVGLADTLFASCQLDAA